MGSFFLSVLLVLTVSFNLIKIPLDIGIMFLISKRPPFGLLMQFFCHLVLSLVWLDMSYQVAIITIPGEIIFFNIISFALSLIIIMFYLAYALFHSLSNGSVQNSGTGGSMNTGRVAPPPNLLSAQQLRSLHLQGSRLQENYSSMIQQASRSLSTLGIQIRAAAAREAAARAAAVSAAAAQANSRGFPDVTNGQSEINIQLSAAAASAAAARAAAARQANSRGFPGFTNGLGRINPLLGSRPIIEELD